MGPGRSLASGLRRRLRGDGAGDDGLSTIETLIIAPLVFLLTFLPIQAALIWHGRQVMVASAQEGARAARAADLTAGQAEAAGARQARRFAADAAGRAVSGVTIRVTRSPEQVQVQVSGRAASILPGMRLTVRGSAVSPVERFVAP